MNQRKLKNLTLAKSNWIWNILLSKTNSSKWCSARANNSRSSLLTRLYASYRRVLVRLNLFLFAYHSYIDMSADWNLNFRQSTVRFLDDQPINSRFKIEDTLIRSLNLIFRKGARISFTFILKKQCKTVLRVNK